MNMNEDILLMLEVKSKNSEEAFQKLYLRYQQPIVNFFFGLGCDLCTSEDYTQEIFLRLWNARANYRPEAKFTTFLFQIAKNYWINEADKKKRRPTTNFIYTFANGDDSNQAQDIKTDDKSPQEEAQENELKGKLYDAINSLKEKHRIVFILSELEGLKYHEIADILQIPIGTVKSRMAIAEKSLRKRLENYVRQD